MVMKNTNTVSVLETSTTAVAAVAAMATMATTATTAVAATAYQKSLSSGNIFSSVFYGGGGGDAGCDNDDTHRDGTGRRSPTISSVLVDSCDRKYDNLYKD